MPIVSTGVPAYASAGKASNANDASYDDAWQPGTTSGWLAYDLSGVPAAERAKAVVWWESDAYGYTIAALPGVCSGWEGGYPTAYTIDANAAPGGSLPATGWATLENVTGNQYKSRQALLDLTGYNWIRLDISSTANSSNNPDPDISINSFEVADAAQGVTDDWVFLGDSITAGAMNHSALTAPDGSTVLSFAGMVAAGTGGANHPIQENAGLPCVRADQASTFMSGDLLTMWPPGIYVAVTLGTNDAWGGDGTPSDYQAALTSIVHQLLGAGDHPILASIPWPNTTAAWQQNVEAMNAVIPAVIAANPGTLAGPDFYTFFEQQPSLITAGDVHPTSTGYAAMRRLWGSWALNTVYGRPTSTSAPAPASATPVASATARGTSSPAGVSRPATSPSAVTGKSSSTSGASTADAVPARPGPGQTALLAAAAVAAAGVAIYMLLLALGVPVVRRAAPARWFRRRIPPPA
ncbi:MAG: SGNH/GDSL hydrolase family protein [Candidatus Dormiibacterota bacterium]